MTRTFALTVTLLLRAAVNAYYAYWLWTTEPGWHRIFEAVQVYAVAEGGLALVMAVQIALHPLRNGSSLLFPVTVADAAVLFGAAVALRLFPGLPDFPVSMAMLYAAVGVWVACLGGTAIAMSAFAIERDRHASRPRRLRDYELFDPILVAACVALIFVAYAFIAGPPTNAAGLRRASELGCVLLGVSFLGGAIGMLLRHGG